MKLGIYTVRQLRFSDEGSEVWEGALTGLGGFAEPVVLVLPLRMEVEDLLEFERAAGSFKAAEGPGLGRVFAVERGPSGPYYACEGFDGPDLSAVAAAAGLQPPVDWEALGALVASAARAAVRAGSAPLSFAANRVVVSGGGVRLVPTPAGGVSWLPTQLGHLLRTVAACAHGSHPAVDAIVRRCERGDYPSLEAALPDLDRLAGRRTVAMAALWALELAGGAAVDAHGFTAPVVALGSEKTPPANPVLALAASAPQVPSSALPVRELPSTGPDTGPPAPAHAVGSPGAVPGPLILIPRSAEGPAIAAAPVPPQVSRTLAPSTEAPAVPVSSARELDPRAKRSSARLGVPLLVLLLVTVCAGGTASVGWFAWGPEAGVRAGVVPSAAPAASVQPAVVDVGRPDPVAPTAPSPVLEPPPNDDPALAPVASPRPPPPARPARPVPAPARAPAPAPAPAPEPRPEPLAREPLPSSGVAPAPQLAAVPEPAPVASVVSPRPSVAPAPAPVMVGAPTATPLRFAEPLLARSVFDVQSVLGQVEREAIALGAPVATVKGCTGALESQLVGQFPLPEVITLYPQAMLDLILREGREGATRSQLSAALKRLHSARSR